MAKHGSVNGNFYFAVNLLEAMKCNLILALELLYE